MWQTMGNGPCTSPPPYCDNVTMWRCDKQGRMTEYPFVNERPNRCCWTGTQMLLNKKKMLLDKEQQMLLDKRKYGNEKSGSKAAFFVHSQGFEPWTHWLRVSCSTNWAKSARGARQRFDFWFAVAKVHRFFVSTKLFRVFFSKKAKKVLFRGFSRKNT